MQVEGQHESLLLVATGARVRNAYATYPFLENSPKKFGLMLHNIFLWHHRILKAPAEKDGHA